MRFPLWAAGALISVALPSLVGPSSQAQSSSPCWFNGQERTCQIEQSGDDLTLRLEDNRTIDIQRRGRCTERSQDGATTRSCNVRIGLPDDFVYGLIVRSSRDGTTITSPRLEIKLPQLSL